MRSSFAVVNLDETPRRFTRVHGDEPSARIEAERLALANAGVRFAVIQIVAEVRSPSKPVEWTEYEIGPF